MASKGIKKFTDFKNDGANKQDPKKEVIEKGRAPRRYIGASNPYDDEINKEILAKETIRKSTPDRQTNLQITKEMEVVDDPTIKPHEDSVFDTKEDKKKRPSKGISHLDDSEVEAKKENVKMTGKVAKFPKGVKASKAYVFMENIKIAKKDIWYLIIERQQNELQMVKYNQKEGVNLVEFVNELKKFYISKYAKRPDLVKYFENIEVGGEDKFSVIKNIPNLVVDGKKVITKITEDLTKLLYR